MSLCLASLALLLQACSGGGGDNNNTVARVLISSATSQLGPEMTTQLNATALNEAGIVLPNVSFEWQSSDATVASVNDSGLVTGVAPGNVAITASARGTRSDPAEIAVLPRAEIRGTAAVGAPLADAEVILKDHTGREISTRTAVDGTFSFLTTLMSPPYLLQAKSADSAYILYSASDTPEPGGVINVTSLTDLIVRSWYRLSEGDIDASFDSATTATWPVPTSVKLIGNVYASSLALWLERAGVDDSTFNPISTEFAADGTGVDRVLDLLTIPEGQPLIISDGDIVQRITLTHDVSNGRLVATSSIESPQGTDGSVARTIVPLPGEQQTAVEAVSAQVTALANTISERGDALTANDLVPFLSPALLHDGLDRADYAAALATEERGKNATCELAQVDSLSGTPLVTEVIVRCVSAPGGTSQVTERRFWFSAATEAGWRIEGNQRLARLSVRPELINMQGAATSQGAILKVTASALAPAGRVLDAVVHGAGTETEGTTLVPRSASGLQLAPAPETVLTIERERFLATVTGTADVFESLGYEFHLTSAAGEKVQYTVQGAAYTTEPVSIVNFGGTALVDAQLGKPLQAQWTLPTTFAVAGVQLEARVFTSDDPSAAVPDCVVTGPPLAASATAGSITIPTQCNGDAPTRVQLRVIVTGAAGERTVAVYEFQRAPADFIPTSMDLPIVRIVTENEAPIASKEDYVRATLTVDPNGTAEAALSVPLRIRGRGNTTWSMPKKPYKLKLDNKASLLGMPSDKDWVLLANYSDKSLLRTRVAFELGNRVGLAWSPRSRFVELFINDAYQGTYQLGEGVKVDNDRVDIPELEEDEISGSELTGGYLLEVDARLDGEVFFVTDGGVPLLIDTPEAPTPEQFSYIQDYIQQVENAIYSDNAADPVTGYAAYIDVDSFINWYLVNEIMKNNDAIFFSSCWMYKQRDGQLFMGPLWDFDISGGNINYNGNDNPTGWWIRNSRWFDGLFEDPAFQARVRARWNELKAEQFDTILEYIDDSSTLLAQGASNNFQRWPILSEWVWPNAVVTGSYEGELQYLREWLQARIAWMDAEFNP